MKLVRDECWGRGAEQDNIYVARQGTTSQFLNHFMRPLFFCIWKRFEDRSIVKFANCIFSIALEIPPPFGTDAQSGGQALYSVKLSWARGCFKRVTSGVQRYFGCTEFA